MPGQLWPFAITFTPSSGRQASLWKQPFRGLGLFPPEGRDICRWLIESTDCPPSMERKLSRTVVLKRSSGRWRATPSLKNEQPDVANREQHATASRRGSTCLTSDRCGGGATRYGSKSGCHLFRDRSQSQIATQLLQIYETAIPFAAVIFRDDPASGPDATIDWRRLSLSRHRVSSHEEDFHCRRGLRSICSVRCECSEFGHPIRPDRRRHHLYEQRSERRAQPR